jgi:hypothetical protein
MHGTGPGSNPEKPVKEKFFESYNRAIFLLTRALVLVGAFAVPGAGSAEKVGRRKWLYKTGQSLQATVQNTHKPLLKPQFYPGKKSCPFRTFPSGFTIEKKPDRMLPSLHLAKNQTPAFLILAAGLFLFSGCSTLDKASMHGFTSGFYKTDSEKGAKNVYIDVTDEKIDVYSRHKEKGIQEKFLSYSLKTFDSTLHTPLIFRKQSLDIDLTTILLKYRPSVYGLPPQLTSDLNLALYAGWRHDRFKTTIKTDALGKRHHKMTNLGYDFGVFSGPGTTPVNSSTTNNRTNHDYSAMIIQTGMAGFLESSMASFGFSVGFDYLLNKERKIWVYNNQLWVGFIVGIALN